MVTNVADCTSLAFPGRTSRPRQMHLSVLKQFFHGTVTKTSGLMTPSNSKLWRPTGSLQMGRDCFPRSGKRGMKDILEYSSFPEEIKVQSSYHHLPWWQ